MGLITQLVARVVTGAALPKEAENNAKLAEQVLHTPGLIDHHRVKVEAAGEYQGELHYVCSDPRPIGRPTVLFVHGSPGSWASFAPYFLQPELLDGFRLIAIDRPGWGASTVTGKRFPSQLSEQAHLLGPLLNAVYEQNQQQKIVLVGHSFGGSLVPVLAALYPDIIRSVLILAGDVSPALAKHRWYNSVLAGIPRFCIKKHWYHSNLEILDLSMSLYNQQEAMAKLVHPISMMQGTGDKLTDPKNVHFADTLFQKSRLTVQWLPDTGHMINLLCVDKVKAAIVHAYESSDACFRHHGS